MSPNAQQLYAFLLSDMEDSESTTYCETLLTQAKAKIAAGEGQLGFMASVSANGKSFTKNQTLTCLEMAAACRAALDAYNGKAGHRPITFPDFSCL